MNPELIEYVMYKLYIGEVEFEEFMDSQKPLDPEFQEILDDNIWRMEENCLVRVKTPTSETRKLVEFYGEEKVPKQLDMYIDL